MVDPDLLNRISGTLRFGVVIWLALGRGYCLVIFKAKLPTKISRWRQLNSPENFFEPFRSQSLLFK